MCTMMNSRATKSAQTVYDRDIFLLVIAFALALSFNIQGLMEWIEKHIPLIASLRLPAYAVALASGGIVGFFSRRIASRITAWRDQR